MFGADQETLPEVQEGSGGPPESPGRVAGPSLMSRRGREALPDVKEAISEDREGS